MLNVVERCDRLRYGAISCGKMQKDAGSYEKLQKVVATCGKLCNIAESFKKLQKVAERRR